MSLSKLTHTAARTATGAAHLGFFVAGRAFGLAKGIVEVGVAAARSAQDTQGSGPAPGQRRESPAARDEQEPLRPTTEPTAEPTDQPEPEPSEDPRDHIPGPDVVAPAVPRAEDLPEPIVIEADDDHEAGEAFQHEPKAAGRESEHEGVAGDREEAEGYLEEVVDTQAPEVDVETPVGTTGADVGSNPATAESDLQQPGTPPIADPATVAAAISEAETLRRAGERNPE